MAIKLTDENKGNLIDVEVSGKIHKADYEHFVPEFERLLKKYGKLRLLFVMEEFHGWDVGGLWEDIKFDVHHFNHIERIAMVGDKAWEEGMARFCAPFTKAQIGYFERHRMVDARAWLEQN